LLFISRTIIYELMISKGILFLILCGKYIGVLNDNIFGLSGVSIGESGNVVLIVVGYLYNFCSLDAFLLESLFPMWQYKLW